MWKIKFQKNVQQANHTIFRPLIFSSPEPQAHKVSLYMYYTTSLASIHRPQLEYLWGQLASHDQILFEASLGWGKGCIMFVGRSDKNAGFHGNRKLPLTYDGEIVVWSKTTSFFIRASSNLQVTRTFIKSWTSLISGQIGLFTFELLALERRKIIP